MIDLGNFFHAKTVAVIGVSRDTRKVGHIIFRNFIDGGFKGNVYPINPKAETILNKKAYPTVLNLPEKPELAIIAVPAEFVPKVAEECGKKGIKDVVIVSSGFKEEGNTALDKKLESILDKYKMRCIGPNCLGTYDAYTKLDSLFLPRYRLQRPREGSIAFVCQSGAVGSSILDLATEEGYGFSKFISYGNAMNIDESDILEYLHHDDKTKVVCLYIEGVSNGRKFLEAAKEVSKKKPIIAIKGGRTDEGNKAVLSHTGALAGKAEVYSGIFRQAGIIEVNSLEEMFETAKILEKCIGPKSHNIFVITNGGGYGILSTDAIVANGLELAKLSKGSRKMIKKMLPRISTENPLDLLGDATTEHYKAAIDIGMADKNVGIILLIVLYQTPLVTPDIVDVIIEANDMKKKPIVVVSAGGEFTDVLKKGVEASNVPTFTFPENAIRAIKKLAEYYR